MKKTMTSGEGNIEQIVADIAGRPLEGIADKSQGETRPAEESIPQTQDTMKTCDCCGNSYEKCFDVVIGGQTFTFDSFECAIHQLAPTCRTCGCRIVGHGTESEGEMYCCANCAREGGVIGVADNSERPLD